MNPSVVRKPPSFAEGFLNNLVDDIGMDRVARIDLGEHEPKRVVVLCAHSDDQVIGAGGAIAKFSHEGALVKTFICSFGEQSHPHLDKVEVRKMRVAESKEANAVLGGEDVLFLGMREGHFAEDYAALDWREKLLKHLRAFRPDRIITHASDDLHPDHRAVHAMALDLHKALAFPCEVYTFDVWNIINRKRTAPRLVVDITHTFTKKLDALSCFKSQKVALFTLLWSVYVKAILHGMKRGVRYAEVFHKVR
jgi:LmbE family N-acetylglucosaminyl deacetylase